MSARVDASSTIGATCDVCNVRGPVRFLCSYHEGVADTLDELEARPAEGALALWFDLTCPRCAGELAEVARSGVHDAGRRATSILKCQAGRSCSRSWQVVLEVQACHYTPAAADQIVNI